MPRKVASTGTVSWVFPVGCSVSPQWMQDEIEHNKHQRVKNFKICAEKEAKSFKSKRIQFNNLTKSLLRSAILKSTLC